MDKRREVHTNFC